MSQIRLNTPLVLVILDGFGIAYPGPGNAITLAKMPTWKRLWQDFPHTTLEASGEAVGLLPHQEGNSEAGHLNIGAGRVVPQDLVVVTQAIRDGTFMKNPAFEEAAQHVKERHSRLHLLGLLSNDQSAHANPEHIRALLHFFRSHRIAPVFLHLFTDGRDAPQFAGVTVLKNLQLELEPHEKVATVMGRFWGMDRKKEWSRTERAYSAIACGTGLFTPDAAMAVTSAYARGESDEFVQPTVITERNRPIGVVEENDAVVFFNARSDRARQLTKAFMQSAFNHLNPGAFVRCRTYKNLKFIALTDFGPDLGQILTAFPSPDLQDTLPMVLRERRQLYIAETDKYAHLTYFFNGGYSSPVGGEHRILVRSPEASSYDQVPEMSANEITTVVEQNIINNVYDVMVINFANPDMVAHTGNLQASIKAVEAVDRCIGRILKLVKRKKGVCIVTADHGNVEEVIDESSGKPDTEHSTNPVPFVLCDFRAHATSLLSLREGGKLADVAPTILELFAIHQPEAMTGKSLIIDKSKFKMQNSN
ncbi:MAG: 2,3-bisphosphoglycerate-independent phosphoglycerate mutase [Patescibacteria group bacterium]